MLLWAHLVKDMDKWDPLELNIGAEAEVSKVELRVKELDEFLAVLRELLLAPSDGETHIGNQLMQNGLHRHDREVDLQASERSSKERQDSSRVIVV